MIFLHKKTFLIFLDCYFTSNLFNINPMIAKKIHNNYIVYQSFAYLGYRRVVSTLPAKKLTKIRK